MQKTGPFAVVTGPRAASPPVKHSTRSWQQWDMHAQSLCSFVHHTLEYQIENQQLQWIVEKLLMSMAGTSFDVKHSTMKKKKKKKLR